MTDDKETKWMSSDNIVLPQYRAYEFCPFGNPSISTIRSMGFSKPPSLRVRFFAWLIFGAKFKWVAE